MFAHLLIASSVLTNSVPRDIHADAPSLLAATEGLVREAAPRLAYDLAALPFDHASRPEAPFRLGYAGYDKPGHDAPELRVGHQVAADIVYDGVEDRRGEEASR